MEKVGLDFSSKKPVKNYSLGMRERLGIAQAIMEDPHIIILDEPFNGLDKNGVQEVYRIIQDLKNEQRTILLVSHNRVVSKHCAIPYAKWNLEFCAGFCEINLCKRL